MYWFSVSGKVYAVYTGVHVHVNVLYMYNVNAPMARLILRRFKRRTCTCFFFLQQPKCQEDSYLEAITNAYVKSGMLSGRPEPQNSTYTRTSRHTLYRCVHV